MLKEAIRNPLKSIQARELKRSQAWLYFLFLSLVLVVPLMIESFSVINDLEEDGQEIAASIPDFTIENGEIQSDAKLDSYVYQTDSLLFFFDPNGLMETETIDANLETMGQYVGVGLMQDQIYINVVSTPLTFSYDNIDDTDANFFREMFTAFGSTDLVLYLFMTVSVFIFISLNFGLELLLMTLFANIFLIVRRIQWPFLQTFKVVMVASTLPTILFSVLNSFGVYSSIQFEAKVFITVFIFLLSLKSETKTDK